MRTVEQQLRRREVRVRITVVIVGILFVAAGIWAALQGGASPMVNR